MVDTTLDKALQNTREIDITVTGRTSGRRISLPVWFVQRGDKLYLLPVKGSDTAWYRNLRKNPTIHLAAGQAEFTSSATIIADPGKVAELVDAFRARYGAGDVRAYYPKTDVALEIPIP